MHFGYQRWWLLACCLLFPLAALAAEPAAAPHSKAPAPATAPTTGDRSEETSPLATPSDKANASPQHDDPKADEEYYDLYKSLADTIDQVERNYVKPVDRRELMEAAIKGIVSKLDPYSAYIGPEEYSNFRDTVESQFGGIGIQVTIEEGQLKVISPLVGTPAYRAGVEAGDKILKIDAEPTDNITLDEATRRLKGDVGTSVSLTVQHADSGKTETFTITRELIHVGTVLGNSRKPDGSWDFMLDPQSRIGYIRITSFSRETADDLRKALKDLKRQKVRGAGARFAIQSGGPAQFGGRGFELVHQRRADRQHQGAQHAGTRLGRGKGGLV